MDTMDSLLSLLQVLNSGQIYQKWVAKVKLGI